MPRATRKKLDVAAKTAEIDSMIAASAKRDEPIVGPAAPVEPAAPEAAKQEEAAKPGRSSRSAKPRATAGRKAASGKPAKPAKPAARKAAKPGKDRSATKTGRKAKAPATGGRSAASGEPSQTHQKIHALIRRKNGASEPEVSAELGWKKSGATISRAIRSAPFKVRKERVDGRTRYFAETGK